MNQDWDDFALTREFENIERRFKELAKGIEGVDTKCTSIQTELKTELDSRQAGRRAIAVAVVTGSCAVLAAMIVAIASILVGG